MKPGSLRWPARIPADGAGETWLRGDLAVPWQEILPVVLIIIGQSTLVSSWMAWHGSSHNYMALLMTDHRMVRILAIESAVLGLLFVYLHWRGWKPTDLRIRLTWGSSGLGLALVFGMLLANMITVAVGYVTLFAVQSKYAYFPAFIASEGPHLKFHSIHVSWLTVIPALVFNGFFEEITCMGYAFNQFAAKRGPIFALILTVVLRMSCHTYQGQVHALGIGAAFFVSGLVYWWTRNLWPLILAHIILDCLSFGAIKFLFG